MALQQISVFLENRAGQLAEITGVLAEKGIDLRALHISETSDYGVLRLIASDSEKAAEVLKADGFLVSLTTVAAVSVPDKPGGLCSLLRLLADNGIDVSYMYSVFGQDNGLAHMVFKVRDIDALEQLLAAHGIAPATLL